jgi:glyoxylase-like metal-dependent hydrolase (beta-lactamase superfamily II)
MISNKIKLGRVAASLLTASLLVPLTLSTPAVADEGQVVVQWFGQSAFKITSVTGKVIMIDPFLTKNPKTPPENKDLAALGKVDLVLVTHAHGDHLGDGPAIAKQHQVPLYGPAGLNDTLIALGELPRELAPRFNKGGTIQPLGEGIRVTMTRAEHSSEYRWNNPETQHEEIHVGASRPALSSSWKTASRSITWVIPGCLATWASLPATTGQIWC